MSSRHRLAGLARGVARQPPTTFGPQGAQGAQGSQGNQGAQGAQGPQGESGGLDELIILAGVASQDLDGWMAVGSITLDPADYTYTISALEVHIAVADAAHAGEVRLWNVTTNAVASGVISSTATVTEVQMIAANLAAGTNTYEVQIRNVDSGYMTDCSRAVLKFWNLPVVGTLVSVPDLYEGYAGTIVVNVDVVGTPWELSVNGVVVDNGLATGANQNVVFTPTSALQGAAVPVVLSCGTTLDTDTTDVYDQAEYVGYGANGATASTSCTLSFTQARKNPNSKVVIKVQKADANLTSQFTSLKYNGVDATAIGAPTKYRDSGATAWWIYTFYIDSASLPVAGTYNVVAQFSGTQDIIQVAAHEYDGVAQGAVADMQEVTGSWEFGGSPALNATTAIDHSILDQCVGLSGTLGTVSPASGQTKLAEYNTSTMDFVLGYELIAAAGVTAADWTSDAGSAVLGAERAIALSPAL